MKDKSSYLDKIADINSVTRIFYGLKRPNIPPSDYFYNTGKCGQNIGYYESDNAFKIRLMENQKEKND